MFIDVDSDLKELCQFSLEMMNYKDELCHKATLRYFLLQTAKG